MYLILNFDNPAVSNLLQPGYFHPSQPVLNLTLYNQTVSNLLQPSCFSPFKTQLILTQMIQPYTIELLLTFCNPIVYKTRAQGGPLGGARSSNANFFGNWGCCNYDYNNGIWEISTCSCVWDSINEFFSIHFCYKR